MRKKNSAQNSDIFCEFLSHNSKQLQVYIFQLWIHYTLFLKIVSFNHKLNNSQLQAYISQNDFRTRNCEFISHNSEKKVNREKSQIWEMKSHNYLCIFFNSLPETRFHTLPIIVDDRIILWQCILGLISECLFKAGWEWI